MLKLLKTFNAESERCTKIVIQYSFLECEKCKWVSKTNVTNIPTPRIFRCVHGTWVARRWGGVAHNLSSVLREQSHKTAWQCTSWARTFDTNFFLTKLQSLVQWWIKCFSFNSGHAKARCTPSATHVRCTRRSQNYVLSIRRMAPYLFTLPCIMKFLEYRKV